MCSNQSLLTSNVANVCANLTLPDYHGATLQTWWVEHKINRRQELNKIFDAARCKNHVDCLCGVTNCTFML